MPRLFINWIGLRETQRTFKSGSSGCSVGISSSGTPSRRVSLLTNAPALLLILAVVADLGQFTDPDLWGHIRFGQAMLAGRHIVLRDVYSYSAFGQPWHNHEWLTEVLMALLYNWLGVVGLKLWKAACSGATILFIAAGLAETGAPVAVQLGTLAIAAPALMAQVQFRPQTFTFVLFAAQLAILARANYRRPARLWLIVPLMALWANLHGGFIIGFATVGMYTAAAAAQDLIGGKGPRRAIQLGLLTAAAALATLLTPFGVETWKPVIHALSNPTTRMVMADWLPMTRVLRAAGHSRVPYLLVVGLIAAFAVTLVLTSGGDDLPLAAVAAMMSWAALFAVRNMPLAVIACTLPVARHSALLLARWRGGKAVAVRPAITSRQFVMQQWIAIAFAATAAACAGVASPRLQTDGAYPSGAVAFMRRNNLSGHVLNDFGWGEYLIWHLYPRSKVFVDGRYDTVFSDRIIKDYLDFHFDLPRGSEVLGSYAHDFVLISPEGKTYDLMTRAREWQVVYRDPSAVLFARAGSPATKIPGAPVTGLAPAGYFP